MRIHFVTYKDRTTIFCPSVYVADKMSKATRFDILHSKRDNDSFLSDVIISTYDNNKKVSMRLKIPLSYGNLEVQAEAYWVDQPSKEKRVLEMVVSKRLFEMLGNSMGKQIEFI